MTDLLNPLVYKQKFRLIHTKKNYFINYLFISHLFNWKSTKEVSLIRPSYKISYNNKKYMIQKNLQNIK